MGSSLTPLSTHYPLVGVELGRRRLCKGEMTFETLLL